MGFLENILTKREIKRLSKTVDAVNALEEQTKCLTDAELRGKTREFQERIQNGETVNDLLPEAFAVCREGAIRALGMRHYDVQIMGGVVLNEGRIAEMRTGEGKTLVATLPVYLNALTGNGVHVVTVNDYLAKRDMEWMGKLYSFLGLTTGVIVHDMEPPERKEAYNADITYGTNNEFGFDYLRDNMVIFKEQMVQRPLNYAIVDEVDSILVDEARTPLIISGQGDKSTQLYTQANLFILGLGSGDYTVDEKEKGCSLTEQGLQKAEKFFGVEDMTDVANIEIYHHIGQALRAHTLMKLDVDYVVKDGEEIVIVDEFTGRLMYGRRYSDGLHQAIEAKEHLDVQRESKTLATITFQNYFRMYKKLAGMTGTAKTEEEEFNSIYRMDVVQIPTNRPIIRDDMDDAVYQTEKGKYDAVVQEVIERHATGQPILIGTISIEKSEELSVALKRKGIPHEVLNAKNHSKEAEIVAQAGRLGQVTIATNMAGRGTDIILGGNPEFMAKKEMKKRGYEDEAISFATSFSPTDDPALEEARKTFHLLLETTKAELKDEQAEVIARGGLCILGTERHEARRIDNQLRGRSGRQGDPGSTRFYISLEDELMRLFGSDRIAGMMEKINLEEDEAIEHKWLSKSIESAQKKVEGRNFSIRKTVLQYDDVMNKQREIIYTERHRVLEGEDVRAQIEEMMEQTADRIIHQHTPEHVHPEEWNAKALFDYIHLVFGVSIPSEKINPEELDRETIKEEILAAAKAKYTEKENLISSEHMRELERVILLQSVDSKWMDHIDAMDQLRQGMGLRALGQDDPVRAYQMEGFEMFDAMTAAIQEDTVRYLMNFQVQRQEDTPIQRRQMVNLGGLEMKAASLDVPSDGPRTPKKADKKPGRNDPCSCGSGKKYKNCCGRS